MTIRDLAHLLLTAPDLDKDVKISNGGYFIAPIFRDILKKEIVDKISIEVNVKEK